MANASINGIVKLTKGNKQLEVRIVRSKRDIDRSIPKKHHLKAIQIELEPTVQQAIFALTRKSHMELMILAHEKEDEELVTSALNSKQDFVLSGEKKAGRWIGLSLNNQSQLRAPPKYALLRIANSTQRIDLRDQLKNKDWNESFSAAIKEKYPDKKIQVLAKIVDEQQRVTGTDFTRFKVNSTQGKRHFLEFELTRQGTIRMARLTGDYISKNLAIVLDQKLLIAPTINTKIWKTGDVEGDFSAKEIDLINKQLKFSRLVEVDEKGTTTYQLPKSTN